MKLVVFSSKNKFHSEIPAVIQMFEKGLRTFHLRKPKFSTKELEEYVNSIPEAYRNRIIIHSHHELAAAYGLKGIHFSRAHRKKGVAGGFSKAKRWVAKGKRVYTKSCHSLETINDDVSFYNYVFLSPVFDSISKSDYKSKFGSRAIVNTLKGTKQSVYALGGVNEENLDKVFKYGFDGVALLGSIWEADIPPAEAYDRLKNKVAELDEQFAFEQVNQ